MVPEDGSADGPAEADVVRIHQLHPTGATPPRRPRRGLIIALGGILVAALVAVGATSAIRASSRPAAAGDTSSNAPAPSGSPGLATPSTTDAPTSSPTTTAPVSEPAPDLSVGASTVAGSVVRVIASTCRGNGIATGFWIDESTVVTSYFGVNQSVAAAVIDSTGEVIPAEVIGGDPATGVALLRPERSDRSEPAVLGGDAGLGEWFTTVELPGKTLRQRTIPATQLAGTDATITYKGETHTGLYLLPGATDVATSGSPMVDASGAVRGMVLTSPSQVQRTVLPAAQLSQGVEVARSQGDVAADCDRPTGPHSQTTIGGSMSKAVKKALTAYFTGINSAEYARAYAALGPAFHRSGSSLEGISQGWVSTYDFNITVHSVKGSSNEPRAWVSFDSIFQPGSGPEAGLSCARWSIDYTFVRDGGRLKINRSRPHGGADSSYRTCSA